MTSDPSFYLHLFLTASWLLSLLAVLLAASLPSLSLLSTYGLRANASNSPLPPFLAALALPPRTSWAGLYALASLQASLALILSPTLPNTLFLLQTLRRLHETLHNTAHSRLPLNPLIPSLGLLFYTLSVLSLSRAPSRPSFPPLALFAVASAAQHAAHQTLAALEKYSLPTSSSLFAHTASPHYLAEIAIYASLASLAPSLNTFLMLAFVAGNLAVTARQTRRWYDATFPKHCLPPNWAVLVPGVW